MPGEIGSRAGQPVLLVREQHDTHGTPRPEVQRLHQPQGLPRHHASAAVVGRSGADVPRIEVAADDDDFFRALAAANLGDDVRGVRVGEKPRVHFQAQRDLRAAVLHALESIGVLGGDGGRGDLRLAVSVAQGARVRCPQPRRSDGSHQRGDGALARGA